MISQHHTFQTTEKEFVRGTKAYGIVRAPLDSPRCRTHLHLHLNRLSRQPTLFWQACSHMTRSQPPRQPRLRWHQLPSPSLPEESGIHVATVLCHSTPPEQQLEVCNCVFAPPTLPVVEKTKTNSEQTSGKVKKTHNVSPEPVLVNVNAVWGSSGFSCPPHDGKADVLESDMDTSGCLLCAQEPSHGLSHVSIDSFAKNVIHVAEPAAWS